MGTAAAAGAELEEIGRAAESGEEVGLARAAPNFPPIPWAGTGGLVHEPRGEARAQRVVRIRIAGHPEGAALRGGHDAQEGDHVVRAVRRRTVRVPARVARRGGKQRTWSRVALAPESLKSNSCPRAQESTCPTRDDKME